MNLIDVRCNNCGAPLNIPENARFATCRFCKAQLAVQQTESAYSTELIGEIAANTKETALELRVIRLQNDLDRLDREYQIQCAKLQVRDEDGDSSRPNVIGGIVILLVGIPFGFGMVSMSPKADTPVLLLLVGVVVLVAAVYSGFSMISKATELSSVESSYRARRAGLLRRIQEAESAGANTSRNRV